MPHYSSFILLFGTTNNYNTKQTKCLHIDFTKNTYRSTNRKNEYMQMTMWLKRYKRLQRHAAHIAWWQLNDQLETHATVSLGPPHVYHRYLKMPQNPTSKSVSFQKLVSNYGTILFQDALGDFITCINNPGVSAATLHNWAHNTLIPFYTVPVFHKFKFTASKSTDRSNLEVVDSVHLQSEQTNLYGQIIPARFDTVLVCEEQYSTHPNKGKAH